MEGRRVIRSAPPGRPWENSESGTESETDTDSSGSSSETGTTYTNDTVERSYLPQRGFQKKPTVLRNYTVVKEVPIGSMRDSDTFLYRTMSSDGGSRISYGQDSQRTSYKTSGTHTIQWDLTRDDERLSQSSSVFEASRIGDMKRLQLIITKHPNVINSKNGMGNTPLHIAAQAGKVEIVKWLATNNANLDAETARGYTAIHLCALAGHVSCIRVLVAMGARLDCVSSADRKTPLHLAAGKGNLECVKWLVANGDTMYATDNKGNTPRALAEQYGHKVVAEFLRTCEKEISDPQSFFTLMKSKRSDGQDTTYEYSKESTEHKVAQTYVSECKIGSLRRDNDGSGSFQPIDIHLPAGRRKNKIDFVTIHRPSGQTEYPVINDRNDGTLSVKFQPSETGRHELDVNYINKKKGGTIPFIVNAVSTSRIVAGGYGLRNTLMNETATFWIEIKDAYTGTPLDVQVGRDSPTSTPPPTPPPVPKIQPKERKARTSRCELSLNIPVTTSSAKADIIFALDSSASVGEKNFCKQLDFVEKIIQHQRIGPNHVQCSLITFATTVRNQFFLNRYHDKESLMDAIDKTDYQYGKTLTGEALRFIRKQSLSPSNGARTDSQQLVIVLTDGASTNKSVTLYEAERLKECNVKVIAIGVGKNVNKEELQAIASDDKNVFRASSFNALSSISSQIKLESKDTWGIRMSCVDQDNGPPSATFRVNCTSPFNMKGSVIRPSGEKEKCLVNRFSDYEYCIKFLPVEVGIHKVNVTLTEDNTPIPGSPFEFMIAPAKVNDDPIIYEPRPIEPEPEPVKFFDEPRPVEPEPEPEPVRFDLENKDIKPYEFKVFSRDGHAGELMVSIEGPSKATFSFDNRKNGLCGVSYVVTEPGEYIISVKCDNEHIEDSPFKVKVSRKCSYVFCDCTPAKKS